MRQRGTGTKSDLSVDEMWRLFANTVTEIHNDNARHLSYEDNYFYAYNLCLRKHGDLLYNGVCGLIKENLNRMAKEFIIPTFPTGEQDNAIYKSKEGENLLKAFQKVWEKHIYNMSCLRDLLRYMDRTHVKKNNLMPIYEAGLDLFIKELLQGDVQETIIHVILDLIHLERDGCTIHRSSMKSCIDIFSDLGNPCIFTSSIEPRMLKESAAFYDKELEKLMQNGHASYWLHQLSNRLLEEESRSRRYLPSFTHSKIQDIVYKHLITPSLNAMENTTLGFDKEMQVLDNLGVYSKQLHDLLENSVIINFRSVHEPIDDDHPDFDLILNKRTGYDVMSAKVGEFLRKDPNKIHFITTQASNTLPGTVLIPKPGFVIQEILYSSQECPTTTVILYEFLNG